MTYFYIVFTIVNFILTAYSVRYAYLISRATIAPSVTWQLATAGFFLRLVSIVFSTLFSRNILEILGGVTPWAVLGSTILSVGSSLILLLFVVRVYNGVGALSK